jgi:hypothetical protein
MLGVVILDAILQIFFYSECQKAECVMLSVICAEFYYAESIIMKFH